MTKSSFKPTEVIHEVAADLHADVLERCYLSRTFVELLRTGFQALLSSHEATILVSIPKVLCRNLEFPEDKHQSGLYLFQNCEWKNLKAHVNRRTALGQEFWAVLLMENRVFLLTASHITPIRHSAFLPLDLWQASMTTSSKLGNAFLHRLAKVFRENHEFHSILKQLLKQVPPIEHTVDTFRAQFETALAFADRMDPWSRTDLAEIAWMNLYFQIQEQVAWELSIDRLMPILGETLKKTMGYDFFEITVFTRLTQQHEHFLSWRKNDTGIGDNSMSLLLKRDFVNELAKAQMPRLIPMTREAGLLNPHLAQLAQLKEGIILPLLNDKNVEGILTLAYKHMTGLQESNLQHLAQIGQMIAKTIANTNAHERMRRMAIYDGLTSLFNRRSFDEHIGKEIRRFKRYNTQFSLIFMDIDNFKNYNDSNGHLEGDHLLQKFSEVVSSSVREQDIVARYGGEEFAVILPHTPAENGYIVAEKIRSRVWETDFPNMTSQPLGRVSVSCGVADTTNGIKDQKEMTERADKALYEAKKTGRNRSVLYSSQLDSISDF